MRSRDLTRLAATTYDVLVIGGGIHGLTIAYEAASRGLRTALVEAGDFGSGTSFNHQKTVHGGLRSLQSASLRRARESILERRALARIAPWFLRPLPFIVGTYRSVDARPAGVRGGVQARPVAGARRNEGVEPELHLPAARLVSKAATLRLFPGRPAREADRRRAVVRLPDGRSRSADAGVRRAPPIAPAPTSRTTSRRSHRCATGDRDLRHDGARRFSDEALSINARLAV